MRALDALDWFWRIDSATAAEVVAMTRGATPRAARLLLLWWLHGHWTHVAMREHACAEARHALALVASPDSRSVACVEVAERYARGEATDEELAEASDAAARAAARAAAWDASDAARAASDAARAASDAARAAAWDAAIGDLLELAAEEGES